MNHEFKDDMLPRKHFLSLQINLQKFSPATDEEKQQHETMRESTTFFRDGMRKLMKNPLAVASLIVLIILTLTIIIVPAIYPYSYSQMITVDGKRDKTAKNLAPFEYSKNELKAIENGEKIFPHIFGTDELCRDYFIRVVFGARVSLLVGLFATGSSTAPGLFYGGGFGVFLRLEQKRLRDKAPLHMTRRESISAAVIAICTFLISNISYVTTNTPFSGRMTTEIFWIRTLVDFAGVAVLLSMQDRWQDMQTQHELTAIQTLLKRQYEQYRISRDNSEAINRKYHDLKHQIQVIRMESDAARREEYLSQLEKGMQSLGVNQHTGNDVLDTILSDKQLYCSQHQITLTIVADGARLDFIETMDICSIFGNALDNAIEGVEKLADPQQRLIRVAVYTQNVFLIIRVENYCTAQLSVVDGEYRTTKHDKDMHGYGIKSIRYTAEKYGGSVSADCSDNWFHLSVLLPLPEKV